MDSAALATALYGDAPAASSAAQVSTPGASAAEVLYGAPKPATTMVEGNPQPAPTKPAASTQEQREPQAREETHQETEIRLADELYGKKDAGPVLKVPDDIRQAREADVERKMYNAQGQIGRAVTEAEVFYDEASAAIPAPMQKAMVAEIREIAVDNGMSPQDVRNFVSLARGIKEAPDEATRTKWRTEARQRLTETYGKEAPKAIADATRFAQRDPRVKSLLEIRGAGDHPEVVLMVARLAREARSKGRFK